METLALNSPPALLVPGFVTSIASTLHRRSRNHITR